jgi:hypothetical protein
MFNGNISPEAIMWQDSSYGDGENIRWRSGFLCMMCGGPVVWGIKLQSIVALSTSEAEYMAIRASVQEVLFLRQLFANLYHAPSRSTRMLEDKKLRIKMLQEANEAKPTTLY